MQQSMLLSPELKYGVKRYGIQSAVHLQQIQHGNSAEFSDTQRASSYRFVLPTTDSINMRESYFSLKLKAVVSTGGCRLKSAGIHSLIDSVTVRIAGKEVSKINKYNMFALSQIDTRLPESTNMWQEGLATGGLGEAVTTDYKTFTFSLREGLCSLGSLLPLSAIPGQVEIELTFSEKGEALMATTSTATITSYTVTDLKFHASLYKLPADYEGARMAKVNSTGLPINFQSITHHSIPVSGNAGSKQEKINTLDRSVSAIYGVSRVGTNVGDQDADYVVSNNGLKTLQIQAGTFVYPSQPLQFGPESYNELLKSCARYNDRFDELDNRITYENYIGTPTKSHLGIRLDKFSDSSIVNGLDTYATSGMSLLLDYASGSAGTIDLFVLSDATITLLSGNRVEFSK